MLELSTKLNAINVMLGVIGEAPINSLNEISEIVEADLAKRILEETSREVQSMKLSFNTYLNYELQPNTNSKIDLPNNTLRFSASKKGDKFVQRGNYVFNRNNNSFIFETNINVDLTILLDYEEIPEIARYYIMIRAARKFQERILGSETLFGFTAREEEIARMNLIEFETDVDKFNILDSDSEISQMFLR
jgi:hypothetical protein